MPDADDLLGLAELARLLDRKLTTVGQWRYRGHLPPPDTLLASGPVWHRSTIERWAKSAPWARARALLRDCIE